MAENVQIKLETLDTANAVTATWLLPAQSVAHDISRQPVTVSLPSVRRDSDGQPAAYAIDFGMMSEILTIREGVSKDSMDPVVPPAIPSPTHHELAEVVRTSWRTVRVAFTSGNVAISGGVRITINEGTNQGVKRYQGVFLGMDATRQGGQLYWTWTLKLQVVRWPITDGAI